MSDRPLTVIHVTHEAVEHIGGIGTVLEGLITSPIYQKAVRRSILVAPLWDFGPHADPLRRLGPHAARLEYSGVDDVDREGLAARLKPVEWAFNTRLVYGTRRFESHTDSGRTGEAELLLVDLRAPNHHRIHRFKELLAQRCGLDAFRFGHDGDFEQWLALAPPAFAALNALLTDDDFPAVVISHEYMGMCTALLAALDEKRRFRTVFHAHECSTARRIVESHPGHDSAFYPAMRDALARGKRVEQVFGDQADHGRHALIRLAHRLDVTLAVGDETANEMRFLSDEMAASRVEVCCNGVPAARVDLDSKRRSRELVDRWLKNVLGFRPDHLFTHVTRPVISKGLWRNLKLCAHMERRLKDRGERAAYLLLTCGAAPRTRDMVESMAKRYNWPRDHHEGYPDLTGPEIPIWHTMAIFNNPGRPGAGAVTALMVNQFGFTQDRLGAAAPAEITMGDLRRAADVEFGQSVYEPFGIAPLEPLHAGAIAVVSSVSGCRFFAERAITELGRNVEKTHNLLVADYTRDVGPDPLHLTQARRDVIEERVAEELAPILIDRLPRTDNDRLRLLETGQALAARMGWDRVCEKEFLPALRSICRQ